MLLHSLWREKPHIVASKYTPSIGWVQGRKDQDPINSQEDLDLFWQNNPVQIPSFVKWHTNRSLSGEMDLMSVQVVVAKKTKFEQLSFNFKKEAYLICVVSCGKTPYSVSRWETLADWMPITHEEYESIVKPNYDHISAKIEQHTPK